MAGLYHLQHTLDQGAGGVELIRHGGIGAGDPAVCCMRMYPAARQMETRPGCVCPGGLCQQHLRRHCAMGCMAHHISSVAFCCISTGEFHFPNDEAARIAVDTVIRFLKEHQNAMDRVVFNVFKDEDRIIYENLIGKERG